MKGLPAGAFQKADPAPDLQFYRTERLVHHIDPAAVAAVTALYRRLLPPDGVVLDLMSSWVSHLPPDMRFAEVIGQGMNAVELARNPRLDRWFVQDLNADPVLPLGDRTIDAACVCVGVQYLQRPAEVFAELARVVRPGGPLVVTFSNRCFPTKAVAIWQALRPADQLRLVALYLEQGGFRDIEQHDTRPGAGDPLWAVTGRAPHSAESQAMP